MYFFHLFQPSTDSRAGVNNRRAAFLADAAFDALADNVDDSHVADGFIHMKEPASTFQNQYRILTTEDLADVTSTFQPIGEPINLRYVVCMADFA